MTQRRIFALAVLLALGISASAQNGTNDGMGGPDGDYTSLYERLSGCEKKSESFNLYFNTGWSFQYADGYGAFAARDVRLEMKGLLGQHLGYRLRYQLNKASSPLPLDNIPSAMDIFILSWRFNEHFTAQAGKIFQAWGGFEYDENPIFIYKYTDFTGSTDPFTTGAAFSWFPNARHELQFSVTNTYTVPLDMRYPASLGLQAARFPFTYVLNWNGNLLDGKINTRWAAGHMVFADGEYANRIPLGPRLNLPRLKWYTDLIGSWETVDYTAIGLQELGTLESDMQYLTMVTKADWRFLDGWNLATQFSLEGASAASRPDYRKRWGALCSLEYFPDPTQDFRLFLAGYLDGCSYSDETGLQPWMKSSLELGFIYRIKAY